jgi:N-acetylneuraminate synthase
MQDVRYIAEFTTNHMGNLNLLFKMVEQAAWAGCDYIKMQKKDVTTFYTREKLTASYISPYGKTFQEYREIFEFSEEDFIRFDKKCAEIGIKWFSTIQDIPSLHFLARFDLPIYKVASTNIRNRELFEEIIRVVPQNKEMVLSTAGATLDEIDAAVAMLSRYKKLTILHCVAEYPCPLESCKLGNINVLKERYGSDRIDIGYSGHEEGYDASIAAVGLGVKMLERHFCISRHSFVHHIDCSLEPAEYQKMIQTVRYARPDLFEQYKARLPQETFDTFFGMSETEAEFLLQQKYGKKYLQTPAHFED